MPAPAPSRVTVIGGGPAGLMAAEVLSAAGCAVTVHEQMPSVGRKLLMAGRGGLNLTHSEALEDFLARYGGAAERLRPMIEAFPPAALIAWAEGLGQPTFVGSSGRVFPRALKASPLLRAWLARLGAQGVDIRTRSEWLGWNPEGGVLFRQAGGETRSDGPDASVLALGGASWRRLGSDGRWAERLAAAGAPLAPFQPANCGFQVHWSESFRERFGGTPLKNVALTFGGRTVRGEVMVTRYGLEGGAIYALSAGLREAIVAKGSALLHVDLRPDLTEERLAAKLARGRAGESLSNRLRKAADLAPPAVNLLREAGQLPAEAVTLARLVKAAPFRVTATQPIDQAISTAGGLRFAGLDENLMIEALPGVFAAGEMLDWEAPTGGYLLQATFATGVAAARGVLARLQA